MTATGKQAMTSGYPMLRQIFSMHGNVLLCVASTFCA
jgi:hypothetical protein